MSKQTRVISRDGVDYLVSTEPCALREMDFSERTSMLVHMSTIEYACDSSHALHARTNKKFVIVSEQDIIRIAQQLKKNAKSISDLDAKIFNYAREYQDRHLHLSDFDADSVIDFYEYQMQIRIFKDAAYGIGCEGKAHNKELAYLSEKMANCIGRRLIERLKLSIEMHLHSEIEE